MYKLTLLLLTALALSALAILSSNAHAGKLSRVKSQTRKASPASTPTAAPEQAASEPEAPKGKLARARQEVRQAPTQQARRDAPRHTRPRRGRGGNHRVRNRQGDWAGFFTVSNSWCYEPAPVVFEHYYPAPPAVVYESQPTVVVPTQPLPQQPIYVEPPVVASIAQNFARGFAAHPYAGGAAGFLAAPGEGQAWLGRVGIETGSASGDVDRTGVAFMLEGAEGSVFGGFGFDFDWDSYTEDLANGEQDELHLGQANLMYRVHESDHALVRLGVGVGWLGDAIGTEAGINFTAQADYALGNRWMASADFDIGTLGDTDTLHASGTVGKMLGPLEIYGGYDYRRIGDVKLQGPMVGVRLWW